MKSHTTTAKNPAGRTPRLADAYLARGAHNAVFWIPKGFGSSTHPALPLAPHITSLEASVSLLGEHPTVLSSLISQYLHCN